MNFGLEILNLNTAFVISHQNGADRERQMEARASARHIHVGLRGPWLPARQKIVLAAVQINRQGWSIK